MITSQHVIGSQIITKDTEHVYASLFDSKGKHFCTLVLQPEDKRSFDVQGRNFERQKERDENGYVVFRESQSKPSSSPR